MTTRTVRFLIAEDIVNILESRLPELELARDAAWELYLSRMAVAERAHGKWTKAIEALIDCRGSIAYYRRRFAKARQNALLDTPVANPELLRIQSGIAFWRQSQRDWRELAERAMNPHMAAIDRRQGTGARWMVRTLRERRRRIWREMNKGQEVA